MKTVAVTQHPRNQEDDTIAIEKVLAIDVVHGPSFNRKWCRLTTTMRSPGHDRELVVGLLFSLGIIDKVNDIIAIDPCIGSRLQGASEDTLTVELDYDREFQPLNFLTGHTRYSGCGVCGSHEIPQPMCNTSSAPDVCVDASTLLRLPELISSNQPIFNETGGCHGAALFTRDASLYALFEDVGRHNALDKLIGHCLINSHSLASTIAVLTSRASFEIVQKAARAGILIVVVMGAVSSLAVDVAREHNLTLVGFLRADRFNVYTAPERIRGV